MWESGNGIDIVCFKNLSFSLNSSSNIVYTSYCWDNPYFITDTDLSVWSSVSLEVTRFCSRRNGDIFFICISKKISQTGFNIVSVNPASWCNSISGNSDRIAVFDHLFAGRDGIQCEFMPLHDVFSESDSFKNTSCGKRLERNCHIIILMNFYILSFFHEKLLSQNKKRIYVSTYIIEKPKRNVNRKNEIHCKIKSQTIFKKNLEIACLT